MKSNKNSLNLPTETLLLPLLYFFGRVILSLALLPNNLRGLGDLAVYHQWADKFGWMYIDAWSEYPPLFPFLNKLIYFLSRGDFFLFLFISAILFSLAGALVILIHALIAHRLYDQKEASIRNIIFFGLLAPLPYTWWYFDLIPVLFMLLGILFLLENKSVKAGLALGLGILTKWFPVFALVAAGRLLPRRKALQTILIALGCALLVFGALYLISPQMTGASLKALVNRNSYETLWALIDGNMHTGEVFLMEEHADPASLDAPRGNPPVIPSWVTLLIFGALGLWCIFRVKHDDPRNMIAVTGITTVIFFLWCSGWSPQWILFLLPLITLSFKWNQALMIASALILLTILEWPVFLARGFFGALYLLVPLRYGLFISMIVLWVKSLRKALSD
jgi:hypothetical protein